MLSVSPFCTETNAGRFSRRLRKPREAAARCAESPPSMATISRRETTPSFNWSTSTCCSAVGLAGRKKDMSAEKWLFQTTSAPASMASSQIVKARPPCRFMLDRLVQPLL